MRQAAERTMSTGIAGFDAVTGGRLPCGRPSILPGGPGNGKTIFGLQTLVDGVHCSGEPEIFVSFDEAPDKLREHMTAFGLETLGMIEASTTRKPSSPGGSRHSTAALHNINEYCRTRQGDKIDIEVVDVVAQPEGALEDGVFLTPVLVRAAPGSQRILIGNLSDWTALREFFE